MSELKIPDDLKACYKLQKQVLRSFRNDEGAVAIAKRTIELIERIAALEAARDELRLQCGDLNMMLEIRSIEPANEEKATDALHDEIAALKAPVSDPEFEAYGRPTRMGSIMLYRADVDALIASRAKETP